MNGSSAPAKEEEEPMDVTAAHTENYQTLIDAGLPQKVAESLDNIFQTGGWAGSSGGTRGRQRPAPLSILSPFVFGRFGGVRRPGRKGHRRAPGVQRGGRPDGAAAVQRERPVPRAGDRELTDALASSGGARVAPTAAVIPSVVSRRTKARFSAGS